MPACASAANPFRASDPGGVAFPVRLRRPALCPALLLCLEARPALFLCQRCLARAAAPATSATARSGNEVEARRDVLTGADALAVLARLRDEISSATYRIHPALEEPGKRFLFPRHRRPAPSGPAR